MYKKRHGYEPILVTREQHLVVNGVCPKVDELQLYLSLGQSKYGDFASVTFSIPTPSQENMFNGIQLLKKGYESQEVVSGSRRKSHTIIVWGSSIEDRGIMFLQARLVGGNRVASVALNRVLVERVIE